MRSTTFSTTTRSGAITLLLLGACAGFCSAAERTYPEVMWHYDLDAPSLGGSAVRDIDGDGRPEIVFGTYFNDERIHAINAEDGSVLWTFPTGGCNDASTAIADVDRDGVLEVIAPASSPYHVYCLNGITGWVEWSESTGYPNCIDSPPAVADVDNDNLPEVVLGAWYGWVFAFNGEDGSLCWDENLGTDSYIQSGPNILDLNADGQLDVVVAQWRGDCRVYARRGDNGGPLWHATAATDWMYHGAAFADVDEDGKPELSIGCYDSHVYLLNGEDGTKQWDYPTPFYAGAPTAIADVNNDGHLEVIFGAHSRIGAVSRTGTLLWSYPASGSVFRGVAIADIDGNGVPDVAFGDSTGKLTVLRGHNGSVLWQINLQALYGNTYDIDHAPVIADLDGDGKLDIFVIGGHAESSTPSNNHGRGYALRAGDGTGPGWRMFRHDLRHSGAWHKPGDLNGDRAVTGSDLGLFGGCMAGPNSVTPPIGGDPADFMNADLEEDDDVDLGDAADLQAAIGT
jgi:outer membrane protein assembly factor BamB